jgi:hypothetical protein
VARPCENSTRFPNFIPFVFDSNGITRQLLFEKEHSRMKVLILQFARNEFAKITLLARQSQKARIVASRSNKLLESAAVSDYAWRKIEI